MSVRLGNNIIAGRSPQPSLFDFKWADHIISDPQWVRADTNSWQYKVAYDAAYNHLEADIEGKEAQSETIEGIIITYYLANDGHKVCLPDQSEYLDALYNTTGVAWYYIVDTINKRFKLPRTKWGFTGIRNQTAVGNYIAAGLPNIMGHLLFDYGSYSTGPYNVTGAFKSNVNKSGRPNTYDSNTAIGDVLFDASGSSSIYGNSLTVQPQATQMYLYFFVGSFTQDALINAAAFSVESIAEVLDEQTTTITETWDTASEIIAADMATIAEDMEQLDTMINAQYHPNIFESKWSDSILNDIQWLRGDTFSWQSGEVYETAYQHLVDDIEGKIVKHNYYPNIQKFGNVKMNVDGILSGFADTTSYAVINEVYTPTTAFEIVVKVHTPNSYADTQSIIGCPVGDYHGMLLRITSATNISVWVSSNGTSWNVMNNKAHTCNIPANSDAWVKLTWDGTTYTVLTSTNGIDYTSIGTTASTGALYLNDSKIMLGGYNWADRAFVGGSIDLKECYIKINDKLIWQGVNTLNYYEAEDSHKIALADQENQLIDLYNKTGSAWYYILDQENTRFKLPRKHSTQIIESVKNSDGSWYKLYADGWIEQGGFYTASSSAGTYYFTLPIEMKNTDYTIVGMYNQPYTTDWTANTSFAPNTPLQVKVSQRTTVTGKMSWQVSGQSAVDVSLLKADEKYRYFYVGKFLQSAVVNTAALNTELFNEKLDLDLANISSASKVAIISLLIPDFARAQTVSMPFTATTYGWFIAHAVNVTTTVYVNNVSVAQGNWASGAWSGNLNCQILVSPGDVVTGAAGTMRFIPCKGA